MQPVKVASVMSNHHSMGIMRSLSLLHTNLNLIQAAAHAGRNRDCHGSLAPHGHHAAAHAGGDRICHGLLAPHGHRALRHQTRQRAAPELPPGPTWLHHETFRLWVVEVGVPAAAPRHHQAVCCGGGFDFGLLGSVFLVCTRKLISYSRET
eukprot:1160791-Pelagomonas_calceolata.AAC.12